MVEDRYSLRGPPTVFVVVPGVQPPPLLFSLFHSRLGYTPLDAVFPARLVYTPLDTVFHTKLVYTPPRHSVLCK